MAPLQQHHDPNTACIEYTLNGTSFKVSHRYKPIKIIGVGAYGVVIAAKDLYTGENVAIKQVSNAFEDEVDATRILREIRLLDHFDHVNVIMLRDILVPPSISDYKDVYIVSELMESDLHKIIYSGQQISTEHVAYFMYQTLCALKHIHGAGVLHRDLKPQNLLVNKDCEVKLCDFGLARGAELKNNPCMTEYVVTRWYRAPEILLAAESYDFAIDVWSVGCIMAELFLKKPLFPGQDYVDMVDMICKFSGRPSESDMDFITSKRGRKFVQGVDYQNNKHKQLNNALCDYISDPSAIDLLRKLLNFNPRKRISVSEALEHPFFREYICPEDLKNPAKHFTFEEGNSDLTKPMLQELIYRESAKFNLCAKRALLGASENGGLILPLDGASVV